MNLTAIEDSIRRTASRMDELDPRRDRDEWMGLCRERQALQRQRWATLRAAPDPLDAPDWPDAPTEEVTQ